MDRRSHQFRRAYLAAHRKEIGRKYVDVVWSTAGHRAPGFRIASGIGASLAFDVMNDRAAPVAT